MTVNVRFEKARASAKARLKKEIDAKPRGASAAMARALNVPTATVSNLRNQSALPGIELLPKLAAYWNLTLDQLVAVANGDPPPSISIVGDAVVHMIDVVGRAHGYTLAEIDAASAILRGLNGLTTMTEEQALDHLETVRGARRRQERAFRSVIEDRGQSALDELGGGRATMPQTARKKR